MLISKCNTPIVPLDDLFTPDNNSSLDSNSNKANIDDKCVNTLELVPSTDALIEVPIKKTFKKPKVYETSAEISITQNDDPYEMILFKGKPIMASENSEFVQNKNQDNIQANIIQEPFNFKLDFEKSLTTTETAPTITNTTKKLDEDSEPWADVDKYLDAHDDDDYEPIESTYFKNLDLETDKSYNTFFEKYPDIWWEGAYRNLSIVPEEDEEMSIRESLSSHKTSFSIPSVSVDKTTTPSDEIYTQEFFKSGSSNLKSDSLSLSCSSSDEEPNPVESEIKIPRAEVKLLVKSDADNKSIEVRSVREFMKDTMGKANGKSKSIDRKKRSQTLPNKFSNSISTISNKLNDLLDKKKSSSYSFLPETSQCDEIDSEHRPTFTLQRLFVRTKDTLTENPNKELIATSKEKFPLNYDHTTDKDKPKIDLYANLPFYPSYDRYPLAKSSPLVSIPTHTNSKSHGAYCDWLLQKEECNKGNIYKMQNELLSRF